MVRTLDPAREGRWAVVTGGSSGIGRAHADLLAQRGFSVLLVGRDETRLAATASDLASRHGVETATARIDLAEPDAAERLLVTIGDREVGVFVAVAGKGSPGDFVDIPLADYLDCVTVKVRTNTVLAHALARQMRARGAGAMLIISSTGGLQGIPSLSVNSGTEAYLLALSEALHHELAPHGIRVTGLMPGPTVTPGFLAMVGEKQAPRGAMTPEATAAEGIRALEAGRMTHVAGTANRAMMRGMPRSARIGLFARMLRGMFEGVPTQPQAAPRAA